MSSVSALTARSLSVARSRDWHSLRSLNDCLPASSAWRLVSARTLSAVLCANLAIRQGIIPAIYVKPFVKGQKNDYNDAEAIAEAALRPNLRVVREKAQDQLDLQALHRVRSRLVSRRTATINQIRAFLIEQGIAVRTGATALRNSLLAILENRQDEISPRMRDLIVGLYEDWIHLDERIETLAGEIDQIGEKEANCQRLMSIPIKATAREPIKQAGYISATFETTHDLYCETQPVHTFSFGRRSRLVAA